MIHYAFYKEEGVFSSTYVLAVASIWNKEISQVDVGGLPGKRMRRQLREVLFF